MIDGYAFDAAPPLSECRVLVMAHHYSARMPAPPIYKAGIRDAMGVLVAAILFSHAGGRWHLRPIELSRLVRRPDCKVPMVSLISFAVRALRKAAEHDLLISFADSTHGHHGGVYQAASWNYAETKVPAVDGFFIDGLFTPSRTCNSRYGTCSAVKLPALLAEQGVVAVPRWDTGKHLYWKALSKAGEAKAAALHLQKRPYPKPLLRPIEYSWQRYRTPKVGAGDTAKDDGSDLA